MWWSGAPQRRGTRSARPSTQLRMDRALRLDWLLGARTNRLTFFAARRRPEARREHERKFSMRLYFNFYCPIRLL